MNQRALLIQNRNANTAGAQIDAEHQRRGGHRSDGGALLEAARFGLQKLRALVGDIFPGGLQVIAAEVTVGGCVLVEATAALFGEVAQSGFSMMAPGRRSKCSCTSSVSSLLDTLPLPKDSTRIDTGLATPIA